MNIPTTKDPVEVKKGDTVIINTDKPVVYNHFYFRRSHDYFTVGFYFAWGVGAALGALILLVKIIDFLT